VVYSLFSYHQKNLGGPGSSKGETWAHPGGPNNIYIYLIYFGTKQVDKNIKYNIVDHLN
jgi:hypothetical protein